MANLVVMCGISGSGKSTWASTVKDTSGEYFGYNIVSTDSIRGELFGDESVQAKGDLVFSTAYSRIFQMLNLGQNVIFDATNLRRSDRIKIINKYRQIANKITCVCFNCSVEDSMNNQNNRARKVPKEVVQNQYNKFQMPSYSEGWDDIIYVNQ